MLIIESDAYVGHYPHWAFRLGGENYKTKDVPSRVSAIKRVLKKDKQFRFAPAKPFAEHYIAKIHFYHKFIKHISNRIPDDKTEIYPDLFPGEGAHLPKKMSSPLWAGLYCTDAVTPIMKNTYNAARGSAECALTGASLLLQAKESVVYALCRPSGHHAGPRVFGGYCYFNNAATAAEYLLPEGKVAIVDIDYHHGNGTQEFFDDIKSVFTASIHCDPSNEYPYFWGYADEKGKGQAVGTNHNEPLPKGAQLKQYSNALDRIINKIGEFNPAFLIIAAGFDTHEADPIGGFRLCTDDYVTIGKQFQALGLPTLVCQEGGYNIDVLGECVKNFLLGLM